MTKPCIHGEVCRAYIDKFWLQRVRVGDGVFGGVYRTQQCIISTDCPVCRFYEPKTGFSSGIGKVPLREKLM